MPAQHHCRSAVKNFHIVFIEENNVRLFHWIRWKVSLPHAGAAAAQNLCFSTTQWGTGSHACVFPLHAICHFDNLFCEWFSVPQESSGRLSERLRDFQFWALFSFWSTLHYKAFTGRLQSWSHLSSHWFCNVDHDMKAIHDVSLGQRRGTTWMWLVKGVEQYMFWVLGVKCWLTHGHNGLLCHRESQRMLIFGSWKG